MNAQLAIALDDERAAFRPSTPVAGRFRWQLAGPAERLELRLFWYTQGRGRTDIGVVWTDTVARPAPSGEQAFTAPLPASPYSFSGKLISLTWALELIVFPGEQSVRRELVMAPDGAELILQEA